MKLQKKHTFFWCRLVDTSVAKLTTTLTCHLPCCFPYPLQTTENPIRPLSPRSCLFIGHWWKHFEALVNYRPLLLVSYAGYHTYISCM